jgi:hypothetical protein
VWNVDSVATSIRASSCILTSDAFIATSDRRIKTNILDIEDDSALTLFRRIQPKTYQYKDYVEKGSETVYGFIAQEVKEVIPLAAKITTGFLPNIYTLSNVSSNVSGGILNFDTSLLEYDSSGNFFPKLKIYKEDDKEVIVKILNVTPTTIQIDQTLNDDKVFVYGQEVNNLHTLNKDAVWTVAAAALQEVDRQLQAEKQKTAALEEQIKTILQRITALESK